MVQIRRFELTLHRQWFAQSALGDLLGEDQALVQSDTLYRCLDKPPADDVDLDLIANRTVSFSGADLENLVNEAALLAGRRERKQIDMESFNLAGRCGHAATRQQ